LIILKEKNQSNLVLINPNFCFLDFCFIANPNRRWLATSPRNPNFLLWMIQENFTTQAKGLETLDPKVEGPSKSLRESPPPSPKEDQPQSPAMGEQPQPEREPCTPNIVDLPIINLQDEPDSLSGISVYLKGG
jgi:hypothetical protein